MKGRYFSLMRTTAQLRIYIAPLREEMGVVASSHIAAEIQRSRYKSLVSTHLGNAISPVPLWIEASPWEVRFVWQLRTHDAVLQVEVYYGGRTCQLSAFSMDRRRSHTRYCTRSY
jgi:CelD/BcsL family acetyltransferase involved in cellulose biosynthesis